MPRPFDPEEREALRAALLAAGSASAATIGMRRTSVESLTRAVGISKGAFYTFFDTREALWVALLEAEEVRTRAVVAAAAQGDDPLRATLRAIFAEVRASPLLRSLADPDELGWLARSLPADLLARAHVDDDAWFGALFDTLLARGAVHPSARAVFVEVPRLALALAAPLPGRPPTTRGLEDAVVDGLSAKFGPGG